MNCFFFKDSENSSPITWEYFLSDLKNSLCYNSYCKSDDFYQVFKNIVISLIIGKEIILLDSDFSKVELENLIGFSDIEKYEQLIDQNRIPLFEDKLQLIEKLLSSGDDWKITLFTSGTTGIPKKVSHNFKSITRFVKISEFNKNNVWGFAYNPTHMAGIQVFFQAILNGNAIVKLFGMTPYEIHNAIKMNNVSHISATPSFYRLLLPCENIFQSVERITSGGEKFSEKTIIQLKYIFPNAKITNVYASTEAGTLFASENDIFSIKPEFKQLIRIENGELLIHNSLIGISDTQINEWYNTGDIVETITTEPLKFRFVTRKSDLISIGGYKVNPIEVEEAILAIPDIKNVRVYAKNNSVLGSIICCEVICDNSLITETTIRVYLQSKIQEFKIPRIIRFVEELSVTRTGKIKRS